jgi:hypothetical protein
MRKPLISMTLAALGFCAAAILPAALAQDTSKGSGQGAAADSSQPVSLAEAARRARGEKKSSPPPKQVWTNEDIPKAPREVSPSTGGGGDSEGATADSPRGTTGGLAGQAISAAHSAADAAEAADGTPPGTKKAPTAEDDSKKQAALETTWRKKFADAHKKLADDEKELDLMQRELNLSMQQYYNDPNAAMRQQNSRSDINDVRKKIDDKKKAIEDDKQALSDLETELRRAGLPSSWSSQP